MGLAASFGGFLRADTETTVPIGPFVDVTDGKTMQVDISLAGEEAELLKHGIAAGGTVDISGNTWTAITGCNGYYVLTLTAGQLDTEGRLCVVVGDVSDTYPVRVDFMVIAANVWDSLFAATGTDYLNVEPAAMAANVITAAAIAAGAIDNATFAADVGSTAYASNIIALAGRKLMDELNLNHLMKDPTSDIDALPEVVDNTILANLMTKTDGDTSDFDHATDSLEAIRDQIDVVEGQTDDIGAAGAGLTDLGGMSTTMKAQVQVEANDAIIANNLDHLMLTQVANNADMTVEVADGTVLSNIMTKGSDTSDFVVATDSLEGARDTIVAQDTTTNVAAILVDTGTTLDDHLTDIKGTGFVTDTNSLVNLAGTPGIEKNVALSNFMFTMVDAADGYSPETGKTVTPQISKDGTAFVAANNSVSEISAGWYKISFDQAEMNYDTLAWRFSASGCRDRNITVTTS